MNIFIKSIVIIIVVLFILACFFGDYFSSSFDTNKHYPEKWSIEKWDLKEGWNPKIYRGERSYSHNTPNTIKDNFTGLIWQKRENENSLTRMEAEQYCNTLSLDDYHWRIPTIKELSYLIDIRKSSPFQKSGIYINDYPALDKEYFDVRTSNLVWSNTKEVTRTSFRSNFAFRAIGLGSGSLFTIPVEGFDKELVKHHVLCVNKE